LQLQLLPTGETKEILSVGLACSECLSGPQLAKVLKRGFEYEQKVMNDLIAGSFAGPLSIHTSSGVPPAMSEFIEALEKHLPWKDCGSLDWCVSLQLEGASAVWAAIDMLLQEQILSSGNVHRKMVAVGATSYHGPPSTSFGSNSPLWHKSYQVKYPVPEAGKEVDAAKLLSQYEAFLDKHGEEIGVLLVEPQWGSSQAAFPWPKDLLQKYVNMAQERGIRVIADEIMCGLGRHGQGTLFISEAWELDPDAVTFGKAVAGGAFPLSGAIIKRGRNVLSQNGRSVMQSHTFAGSSQRALMTATDVLNELPTWLPSITKLDEEMRHIFSYLEKSSKGMLIAHGQGLMWGCLFSKTGQNEDEDYRDESFECFKKHCADVGVIPYFVPAKGFMITPVVDIDVGTIYEIGEKLAEALDRTMAERDWKRSTAASLALKDDNIFAKEIAENLICLPSLHFTKSCTSCADFVCRDKRMRFVASFK
jgi:adenosylmethionine-8-amino-7-oxononanoate aminotransferase